MTITKGIIVKFSSPNSEDEAKLRFTVIEDRDGKLLVQLVCDEYLKPTFVYLITDLVKA
jgi:hypothetical protein